MNRVSSKDGTKQQLIDRAVQQSTGSISEMEYPRVDDNLPLPQELSNEAPSLRSTAMLQEPVTQRKGERKIKVLHHGQILKELIAVFCEESILVDDVSFLVILPNGGLEKAVDDGSVLMDVLLEFWQNFYEKYTLGRRFKVPYLSLNFGKQQ